jgi:hypothetical protein
MCFTVCIVKNPIYVWDARRECDVMNWDSGQGDRRLDFYFDIDDLNVLQNFLDIKLTGTDYLEGESFGENEERLKRMYLEAAKEKGYEMLGRIWYCYDHAIYFPPEINRLLAECQKLKENAQNPEQSAAMDKLINACGEAFKTESGIYLEF